MITISSPKTEALVRRYAKLRKLSMTAAIDELVSNALVAAGESIEVPVSSKARSLKAQLADAIRAAERDYVRLREAVFGKRSGSRLYGMLSRHDVIDMLRRLIVPGPTDGLRFLAEQNRHRDLAVEAIVVDSKFASIVPEDIKAAARRNLAWAEQHGEQVA